jgi:hypothetical protein
MKNIHVLPTDKPSRLSKSTSKEELTFCSDIYNLSNIQHIYINSDEEIKEGDWFITTDTNEIHKSDWIKFHFNNGEKIILTTDQDLINDGVQAIDDEFLEWFVKNPSCEFVKAQTMYFDKVFYKIIIPKEEPKQECECTDECLGYLTKECRSIEEPKLSNICIKCGVDLYALEGKFVCLKHPKECKGIYLSKETLLTHIAEKKQKQHLIDMMKSDEEPKQETLEEASFVAGEESFKEFRKGILEPNRFDFVCGFTAGAKWQQERIKDDIAYNKGFKDAMIKYRTI